MAKYFLHGGKAGVISEKNTRFFQEMIKGFAGPVEVLCVYFAKDKSLKVWDWNLLFEQDKRQIASSCMGQDIHFVLASDDLEVFTEQVKQSQLVFLAGGITPVLVDTLKSVPNLKDLWQNKVVAGTSAGALALSRYYYDGDSDTFREGLSILPVKLICHWGAERFSKLDGLKRFGAANIEVHTIPEQEFIVLEQ